MWACLSRSKILRALKKRGRPPTVQLRKLKGSFLLTEKPRCEDYQWWFLSPGSIMTKESFSLQRLIVIFREKDSEHSLYSMKISHLTKPFPKSAKTRSRNEAVWLSHADTCVLKIPISWGWRISYFLVYCPSASFCLVSPLFNCLRLKPRNTEISPAKFHSNVRKS